MPPQLKPTHYSQETLPKLVALARTFLACLDELAQRELEVDDRPRIFANALVRWALEDGEDKELRAASRALASIDWRAIPPDARNTPWAQALHAANALRTWRVQCLRYPSHTPQGVVRCAQVLTALWCALGESPEAAGARVGNEYAARMIELTGQRPLVLPTDPKALEGIVRFANARRFGD